MKKIHLLLLATILLASCSTTNSIENYSDSPSHFTNGPKVFDNPYPAKDTYRIFKKGKTGASSLEKLRSKCINDIRDFANSKGRSAVIIAQAVSNGPYIFGQYPSVEIVFALK